MTRPTLITGLPRSGTTLTVALLNQQPDAVALAEPLPLGKMSSDPDKFADEIEAFTAEMRRSALEDGVILTKAVGGQVAGNFVTQSDRGAGLRRSEARRGAVALDKPLSPDFRLYIKHPAAFTALTGPLSARFDFFACIRSPLSVLASWQTVDMPINRGRVPMAEKFAPELTAELDAIPDALGRQVYLMGWFLEHYAALPRTHVLRFEDLASDASAALAHICPGARVEGLDLESQDLATRYPSVDIDRLRTALKPVEPAILHHYPEGLPY
ncbi:hypothetical protein [Marimonas arenosa]|uniref:Sulfotransferase n=1 Tax=Marimonas arenosa TaxID=1795305 RepID=A0AAE4B4I7_9RHOB|nr:hypothetical protein [Marimonas arenosa]MDQ2090260.1 sulfotransferase [Marimonas arenosa]